MAGFEALGSDGRDGWAGETAQIVPTRGALRRRAVVGHVYNMGEEKVSHVLFNEMLALLD
jgi:hypothetical protein